MLRVLSLFGASDPGCLRQVLGPLIPSCNSSSQDLCGNIVDFITEVGSLKGQRRKPSVTFPLEEDFQLYVKQVSNEKHEHVFQAFLIFGTVNPTVPLVLLYA